MNGEWLKEATTLGLVTELIDGKRKFAKVSKSKWYKDPWRRFRRDKKLANLTAKARMIGGELAARYEGILCQMFQRANAPKPFDEKKWRECQTAIWIQARDTTRNLTDYRIFFAILWEICLVQIGHTAFYLALRPKFMLRPFVDEMPYSDERGVLRATAFERNGNTLGGRETLDFLSRSFPILHRQLLSRHTDLKRLTDSEMTLATINPFVQPYPEYRHWLFEC